MIAILIVTLTALLLSFLIVFISEKYKSEDESKKIEKLLPGYNCGVCGYGTCQGLAQEMIQQPNLYQKCKPLRGEALTKMEAYLKERL